MAAFVIFMALLTWIHPQKFWCIYALILGVAVKMGFQIGMVGMIVWMGLGKVLDDIINAGRQR